MRLPLTLLLLAGLGLAAQTPAPEPAAAAPAVKWRGALWASGAVSNRQTEDGSLFLRSMDAGEGRLSLDGLQLGADVALPDGFAFKVTLLAGQTGKILNASTLAPGGAPAETGSIAWPEAMITWTGKDDILRFGRMYTPMGMEVMDHTQDVAASRGLLFTYAIPFAQVGLNWHHAFTPSWSTDVWLFNGEDRVQDNNREKTAGLGLTYNHGGAADKFVTVMAFSGAEQDSLGASALPGAAGRKRNRFCLSGQWVWGPVTLQFEGESAQETFAYIQGTGANAKATWSGGGATCKYQISEPWAAFARLEVIKDDTGLRLGGDPTVAATYAFAGHRDLQATSGVLGVERRWHATFSRLELRQDSLDKNVSEAASAGGKRFKDALSLTWSLGTSF
jgi:hypothetical protein